MMVRSSLKENQYKVILIYSLQNNENLKREIDLINHQKKIIDLVRLVALLQKINRLNNLKI